MPREYPEEEVETRLIFWISEKGRAGEEKDNISSRSDQEIADVFETAD
jgi:hypothetical protein